MRRHAALAVFAILSLVRPVHAEEPGALSGTVRTQEGAPVPLLVVLVTGMGSSQRAVTGPEGRYRVTGLAPGEYTLTVEAPGFTLGPARAVVGTGEAHLDLVLSHAPVREHVVVAATRSDAALSTIGIATSALDRERIAARGATTFLQLVQEVPGVSVAQAGGVGAQASAFVRGGASNFARLLVDGVPVNEPGGAYDFGGEIPLELERVEVVRGAASSLYGTDALAGVIHLVTRKPAPGERPGLHAELEGGTFDWWRLLGGTSGRAGRFDWNAGLLRLETDNQEPNSRLEETSGAASLGAELGERTSARLVVRGRDAQTGTPGPTAFGRPDLDAYFDRQDLVLSAEARHARARVSHLLRAGLAHSDQLSVNPIDSGAYIPRFGSRVGAFPVFDFPDPAGFQNDTTRLSFGYQAEVLAGSHLLVTGADLEREMGEIGIRSQPLLSPERTNVGLFLQDRFLTGPVFLTLGGRLERNASFGTRAVPRGALAWRVRGGEDATTIKASAGAGIKEPSFFESFGISSFARGNPDLEPERSRTFDLGMEQRLFGSRLRAELTLYQHTYHDQIAFRVVDVTTFQGTFVNVGKSRARGLEAAVEVAPTPHLQLWAAYTYLDSEVLVSTSDFDPVYAPGETLLRRPRHQGALSVRAGARRIEATASLVLVGRRADSDFLGLGLTENDAYARLDARLRFRVAGPLELFAAFDNLTDERYQEVLGYPALRRAARAGLRLRTATAVRP